MFIGDLDSSMVKSVVAEDGRVVKVVERSPFYDMEKDEYWDDYIDPFSDYDFGIADSSIAHNRNERADHF